MVKAEWGTKRTCHSCGTRFYDLTRSPIICPKCSAEMEPDIAFRPRRQIKVEAGISKPGVISLVDDVFDPDLDVDKEVAELIEEEDSDESNLMEDTSDLGEDDDDMAEVREHIDNDIEGEI